MLLYALSIHAMVWSVEGKDDLLGCVEFWVSA